MRLLSVLALTALQLLAQCDLTTRAGLHLGPTDNTRLRSTGDIRMLFLFVDFPDAPADEDARQLYDALVPFSQQWIDEVSYGRAKLNVTPVYQWFRMPKNSGDYNFARGLTFDLHRAYITDAVNAADSAVNFAQYDGLYIIASRRSQIPFSPTFVPAPGAGVRADGVEIRHVITLGNDTRQAIPVYQWHVISHETGHLFGLPDLYLFNATGLDAHVAVSGWDNMGWIFPGAHFTAWQKRKLGWLTGADFACVTEQNRYLQLSPLSGNSGVRGLAVQTGPSRAIVAELRRPIGQDARLCDFGLLVYTVDSSVASGSGPLRVVPAQADSTGARYSRCGPLNNATYNIAGGKPSLYRDNATGVTIEILGEAPNSGLHVRVSNPGGRAGAAAPVLSSVIGAGAFGATRTLAPGGWAEIFGQNLAPATRSWSGADFAGTRAPNSLDDVRVFVGSQPAYVSFISPAQINFQVPDGIGAGDVPVVVTNGALASNTLRLPAANRAPGLLAPASFAAGSRQYVVAILPDGSFAGPPNLIPGAPFRRAEPGSTVVLYGVGFGPTSPNFPAGQVVDRGAPLPNFTATVGGAEATVTFAGLAPNLIGLYQFNVVIPPTASGDAALVTTVDGVRVPQDLWLAVQ